jgi:hypothetical protein
MMKCKHCEVLFEGNRGEFANHVRWCDKNPKQQKYKDDNSSRGKLLGNKKFGEYKNFTVTCSACDKDFFVKERELLHPKKDAYFCSRNCANSTGGKAKSVKYHYDEVANYATVAWRHHKRECVACGENNVVAAHHLNEDHSDNRPENFVPLCPTHHHYIHSKYKYLIIDKVNNYIDSRKNSGS